MPRPLTGLIATLVATLLGGGLAGIGIPASAQATNLSGQLLVATPELRDPHFDRTVIYLLRHDAEGAMGVVVNRPIGEVPLASLLRGSGLDAAGATGTVWLHEGGPVEPTRVLVLHTDDYAASGTTRLGEGLAFTWQVEILRALAAGGGPRRAVFALGYAGWAPGQLEDEIRAGAWVSVPADHELLFDDASATKWERAYARRRISL